MIASFLSAQFLTHVFFLWAQKIKNWGVIDIAWGLGFLVTTYTASIYYNNFNLITLLLISIWGLRLAIYLFRRNHGKPEDWRYRKFREDWKPKENINAYLKVFVFQGVLMFLISLPQILFIKSKVDLKWGVLEIVGLLIWIVGITFEVLADTQLEKFKKDSKNKGRILQQGVWRLSRHPNYFGEVTLWWGFFIMLINYIPLWSIIGPLLITFFIANVTGIPLLEEKYKNNPDFQVYKGKTNMLFPWFPKKG